MTPSQQIQAFLDEVKRQCDPTARICGDHAHNYPDYDERWMLTAAPKLAKAIEFTIKALICLRPKTHPNIVEDIEEQIVAILAGEKGK